MKEYRISWHYIAKLIEKLTGDDISGMQLDNIEYTINPDTGEPISIVLYMKEAPEESVDEDLYYVPPEAYMEDEEEEEEEEVEE